MSRIDVPPMPEFGAKLVFRITLEFLVDKKITGRRANKVFEPTENLLAEIVGLLDGLGYSAFALESFHEPKDFQPGLWQVSHAARAEAAPEASWFDTNNRQYIGVSIRTPFFSPNTDWTSVVEGVCKEITSKRTVGMNTNASLKVEIKPDGNDLDLESLKTIIRFLWSAAPLIDQLHPPHCASNSFNSPGLPFTVGFSLFKHINVDELLLNKASVPYLFNKGKAISTSQAMLELSIPENGSRSAFYAYRLRKLSKVTSMEDLIQKMNILPVENTLEELTDDRTIGLSQHSGTLDVTRIYHWVAVCLSMVDTCLTSAPERMEGLLEHLGDPILHYTVSDSRNDMTKLTAPGLLRELQIEETANYFEALGRNPHVPELATVGLHYAVDLEGMETDAKDEPQYTFGAEMEFMVPAGEKSLDPHPQDPRWFLDAKDWHFESLNVDEDSQSDDFDGEPRVFLDLVAQEDYSQVLRERVSRLFADNGFFAMTCDRQDAASLHRKALDGGYIIHSDINIMFQAWHIQHDISLGETADPVDGYSKGLASMEVASALARANRAGFRRLADGISVMRNTFRIIIPREAGLHIHVAPHNRRFDLLQLKRITTVIWFAEPITQLMIASYRRGPICQYCLPISTSSDAASGRDLSRMLTSTENLDERERMKEDLDMHVPLDQLPSSLMQNAMKYIWNATTLEDLVLLTCNSATRCAVTLAHIRPINTMDDKGEPALEGTIEFRSAQGTMDQAYIIRWARLCVALVRKGQHGKPKEIHDWVARLVQKAEHPVDKLPYMLESLGLNQDLEFWQNQIERFSVVIPNPPHQHVSAVSEQEVRELEEMLEKFR
ncbi:hypothetical protein ACHAQH_005989 [Verticillium albo-atrum]